ncbi:MAG: ATP-binding protein [Candidatus Cloacimonetes bacterium]|nr:ATP-binding protein [Candidatus Cloacimonadota bacterium]
MPTFIPRQITDNILSRLHSGKAIIIFGPRQSGKTTLLNNLSKHLDKILYLNCDDAQDRQALENQSLSHLKSVVGTYKSLLIDEAQRVSGIGLSLKILVDNMPQLQIIATSSSSFELSNQVSEPLTGRKYEYLLLPIAFQELLAHHGGFSERKELTRRLVFGAYPDIINNPGQETELLNLLAGSYLFKDVFSFQDLRRPELLKSILRALALQISSEVSYTELAQLAGTNHVTIQRYIQLLEAAFIIFRLPNYSTNQRNEIKRSRKIYFWDNGVRNSLINDFRDLENRNDIGSLWENYLVSERLKYLRNNQLYRSSFFWRSLHQSEIDYLELYEDKLDAYEMKWNPKRKAQSRAFSSLYPHAKFNLIHPDNYTSFLS